MNKEYIQRKHPRLKDYDYSQSGAYYITICTQDRLCILSKIVGRGLAPAEIRLSEYGEIVREQLLSLEDCFPSVSIDQYVIMPNHIHILFLIDEEAAGASPRPTIMDVICAFKSLATRACKKAKPIPKLFQDSFYEHVLRNIRDYEQIAEYISANPARWEEDELYIKTD